MGNTTDQSIKETSDIKTAVTNIDKIVDVNNIVNKTVNNVTTNATTKLFFQFCARAAIPYRTIILKAGACVR